MKKKHLALVCLIVGPSIFPMEPQEEQGKPSKLAVIVASFIGTAAFAYPMIRRHVPFANECENCAVAASLGMFGMCFGMHYYYPPTEEERAMHTRQFGSDAVHMSKNIIKKVKRD